jgi:hypothetical protein
VNKRAIFAGLFLILLSLSLLLYKIFFLEIPFLPFKSQNSWRYEIQVNKSAYELLENQLPDRVYLPIPPQLNTQFVETVDIKNQEYGGLVETTIGKLFAIDKSNLLKHQNFKVEAIILTKNSPIEAEPQKLKKSEKQKYLDLNWLKEDELQLLKNLNSTLIYPKDSKKEIFDKITYFLLDEFIIKPTISNFKDVIEMKNGDSLSQAKIFMGLTRLNKIPSRISFGTTVKDTEDDKNVKHMRIFINEYYLDGRWQFFHPDFPNIGTVPKNFILIHRDITPELELFNSRDFYSTKVKPIHKTFYDSKEYFENVIGSYSKYSLYSLYRLPLGSQNIFFTLLLVPIGTLILSFARNIIGLITFGVFTPILLTLFFIETSFLVGMAFLLLVFIVGIILHFQLNKLYLLAVPKLSIILTVVILLYVGFALYLSQGDFAENTNATLNYFPIVIISVFTERFMILLREEGLKNTVQTLVGTLIVSTTCYFIFSIKTLSVIVFNHPELLLITIGLNIFIGSYTGFRLSEFFRFKELLENKGS